MCENLHKSVADNKKNAYCRIIKANTHGNKKS